MAVAETHSATKQRSSTASEEMGQVRHEFRSLADVAERYAENRLTQGKRAASLRRLRRQMVRAFAVIHFQLNEKFHFPRQTWLFLQKLEYIAEKLANPDVYGGNSHDKFYQGGIAPNFVSVLIPQLVESLDAIEPELPQPRRVKIGSIEELEAEGLNHSQIARQVGWRVPGAMKNDIMADDHGRVGRAKLGREPWPEFIEYPAGPISGWPMERPAMKFFLEITNEMIASNAISETGADQDEPYCGSVD